MNNRSLQLTIFQGRAGDRNPRGMSGALVLGRALAARTGDAPSIVGTPSAPLAQRWDVELEAARPGLRALGSEIASVFDRQRAPLTTIGRCACALATLPVVARYRPDATIVWFDAHGDLNTPATSTSGYLGGIVLTGAAGLWPSGLGEGLRLSNVVLVGARDLDPSERALIDNGTVRHVAAGTRLSERLRAAIGDAPVYVHIDCDVLDPDIVPTEYSVAGGLSLADLRAACEVLAANEVVGVEIAELEATWAHSGEPAATDAFIEALSPVLGRMR